MRHLKTYEDLELEPQIGDYVICEESPEYADYKIINSFLKGQIGQIVKITDLKHTYTVKFPNIKKEIFGSRKRSFSKSEIVAFSKNIEDLEKILTVKKYNL